MKDAEFIELLNLYLDHEISPADAARLEAEVQRNPARRQVYRQYCQMQKACSMLAADFTGGADQKNVIAFEPRRSMWSPAMWTALSLAAAACVALAVYFNRPVDHSATGPAVIASYAVPVVEPQTPPPAAEARAIARTVTVPSRAAELQPVLTAVSLNLGSSQNNVALAPVDFEWINQVKLAPMQIAPVPEELRFETRPVLKPTPAIYRSARPMQGTVEMTGFQFQK